MIHITYLTEAKPRSHVSRISKITCTRLFSKPTYNFSSITLLSIDILFGTQTIWRRHSHLTILLLVICETAKKSTTGFYAIFIMKPDPCCNKAEVLVLNAYKYIYLSKYIIYQIDRSPHH